MIRKVSVAALVILYAMAGCGDDDDDGAGGSSGKAGQSSGGSAGRGGSAGASGAGTAGTGGTNLAGSAGVGGGGTSGSSGSGGSTLLDGSAGSAGNDASAGAGGTDGGAGTDGSAGSDAGTDSGTDAGTDAGNSNGLVAYYSFNEGSGTKAANAGSKTLADATLTNGAMWTAGRTGSSAQLGTTANSGDPQPYVTLPAGIFDGVHTATIAVWVYQTAHGAWSRVFDVGGSKGWLFLAADTAAGLHFAIYPGDAAKEGVVESGTNLPLNVWKHVAVTVNGAQYSMYIDGHPVASVTTKATDPTAIGTSGVGWLGKSRFDVDPYFKGQFDELRVYDRVLTQAEIADLAWPKTDYSYWRFDETSGTTATDSSDRDFNGTLHGGGWTAGKIGGALDLTNGGDAGANEYVSFQANMLAACNSLTIALWAKLRSNPPWVRFLDVDGTVNGFLYFSPNVDDAGKPSLFFDIFEGSDQAIRGTYPESAVLIGQWHHYAVTLAGNTGIAYFDGEEIGRNAAMTFKPSDLSYGAGAHAWFGRSLFAADPYLNATVDDLRIACRAFSADEIQQLSR